MREESYTNEECRTCKWFREYYHGDGRFSYRCWWHLPDIEPDMTCDDWKGKGDT